MGNGLAVIALVGRLVVLFALLMAVPLAFALVEHDLAERAFLISIGVTLAAGVALSLATRRFRRELQPRDGFVLVALTWLVLPAFAALPLLLAIPGLSVTDAYFEAMSGFTATGATVLTGLDALPLSVNVWRCFLMWVGGLGIVVLAEFVASHYLTSGALVRVLPGWQCPSMPLHLVTPTTRKRAARVQAFMDWAHALLLRRLGSQLDSR